MLVLDLRGASGGVCAGELAVIHEQFQAHNAAVLSGLVGPDTLELVRRRCSDATFLEKDFGTAVGRRGQSADLTTVFAVTLALNREPLLAMLEGLLPQPPPVPHRSITGHVARHRPDASHELYWHDDLQCSERLLGITVNLGAEPYSGGRFQLRVKANQRITADLVLEAPGDAFVFAISPALEHRVTPVTGEAARTVFTGWLVAEALPSKPLSTLPR
jgi:2OG-Fe(II) oxygenase superfamily